MEFFHVGGSVRDSLLGRPIKDYDFVVVGATPDEMLQKGFTKVGADFPVFLNSIGEEFALARTERKTSSGYNGFETNFDTSVTLEDDLFRRDLTINAMARGMDTDNIIDPFNGQEDLRNGILRHVSDHFAEDPVRVLRVARFAARYGFSIAPETMTLMKKLVDDGELDHLTPERVWAETEKALMEDHPSQFFHTLMQCGASDVIFPELGRSIFFTGLALNRAAIWGLDLDQRVMILMTETSSAEATKMLERLKAPVNIIKVVSRFCTISEEITKNNISTAEQVMDVLNSVDAWRNGNLIRRMTISFAASFSEKRVSGMDIIIHSLFRAQTVCFATLSPDQQKTLTGKAIGEAIQNERLNKVRKLI